MSGRGSVSHVSHGPGHPRDDGLGTCSSCERQLRLVGEDDGPPAGGVMLSGRNPTAPDPLGRDIPSLAAYLGSLAVGSPCFSCGAPLVHGDGTSEPFAGGGGCASLECPSCGASLEGSQAE